MWQRQKSHVLVCLTEEDGYFRAEHERFRMVLILVRVQPTSSSYKIFLIF